MKAISGEIKKIILVNAFLDFLYLFFNWGEYLGLNSPQLKQPWQIYSVSSYFPWYFRIYSDTNLGTSMSTFYNFTLVIFLLTVLVNLYFIFRLQRGKVVDQS